VKFKDKIVKAFRMNGVARSEQVEKLRKVLSEFALSLVPESTVNIDKAFDILKSAFGDLRKVLDDRMYKLKAVRDLPPERLDNEKSGFRKQEEWYLTIEGLLSEIIDLGERKEDLDYHTFSYQTFKFVLSLFPSDLASWATSELEHRDLARSMETKLHQVLSLLESQPAYPRKLILLLLPATPRLLSQEGYSRVMRGMKVAGYASTWNMKASLVCMKITLLHIRLSYLCGYANQPEESSCHEV
jgi:hypothetical protein